MIITCPECATRYDLEDDRFQPNGRSVRCTACGESWYVPAPEPIDAFSRPDGARREPPRREARDDERRNDSHNDSHDGAYDRGPATWREPRMEARPTFARSNHHSEAPRQGDDRSMRAERSAPGDHLRFSEDGRDEAGHPQEAEISIVTSADKDLLPPRDEKGRFMPRERSSHDNDRFDDDEDDTLFDSPDAAAFSPAPAPDPAGREADRDAPPKGWRKGKQFYVEDGDDARDEDPRPFFAKHFSKPRKDEATTQSARRGHDEEERYRENAVRNDDEGRARQHANDPHPSHEHMPREARRDGPREPYRASPREAERDTHSVHAEAASAPRYRDQDDRYNRDYEYERGYHEARARDDYDDDIIPGEATILDADWEDVEEGHAGPRFGRRIREGRRRATALARLEDVRRFEPEMLDEEFFRSLHVTPHELEKAVRKARRRAEARDKNRLTPWRAFGWSAWVAAVAGAAYAVVAYRDEIVRAAPTAAEAYAVVGIETDPVGLKIENVSHRLAMSTGGPMIEISGSLRNLGGEALDAPLLQAEALGPRGELLARWTFKSEASTVDGGGVSAFTTRNTAPDGVSEVALSFAPTQSAVAPR